MKILKPYKFFKDERGSLTGIINQDKWSEINYFETAKGQTRGNHYHKKTLELFYILEGEIGVTIKNLKTNKAKKINLEAGNILLIEPFELHTFVSNTECKWINILSRKIDEKKPDIYKIEQS
jgi:quercetin dioxygenase-like cupin family protein